jgi:putative transposase
MRYIEENPVRAGLAAHPGAYPWSSYRANALGEASALVTPHPHYYSLGRSPEVRRAAYAALFAQTLRADRRLRPSKAEQSRRA